MQKKSHQKGGKVWGSVSTVGEWIAFLRVSMCARGSGSARLSWCGRESIKHQKKNPHRLGVGVAMV